MKLTQNHIQALYKFTRQHYVEYYDVQTELVDHLANDIEEIWEEYPKLSFEEARDKSFKKFGIFGFMNVVEKKEWQMTKKYFKITLQFAKEWFKLPKIILILLLFLGLYQLQKLQFAYTIFTSISFLVFIIQTIMIFKNGKKLKDKNKKTGKSWMFENIILTQGIGNSALLFFYFFYYPFLTEKDFLAMGTFSSLFVAFYMTLVLIFGYIALVVIPNKAEKLLQETYPEYKLS